MDYIAHLVDRIPEGIHRTEDTISGPSLVLFPLLLLVGLFWRSNL